MSELIECNACGGYGFRYVKVIWDYYDRKPKRKTILDCRKCGGEGYL